MPKYPANGTKYQVGFEFPNHKRLTEHKGSHPAWKTSMWMWECVACHTEYGPSMINSITRLDRKPRCCFRVSGESNPSWKGYKDISGVYLNQCRYGAAKRKLAFTVTPEQLWDQWLAQDGMCRYTGRKLTHGTDASLDRIDSSQGYVPGNIQWVHKSINWMKSDMTEDIFLDLCREVTKHMSDNEEVVTFDKEPTTHIFTGDPNHPANKNISHARVSTNRVVDSKPPKDTPPKKD